MQLKSVEMGSNWAGNYSIVFEEFRKGIYEYFIIKHLELSQIYK